LEYLLGWAGRFLSRVGTGRRARGWRPVRQGGREGGREESGQMSEPADWEDTDAELPVIEAMSLL
jgi:hypothetical protein